MTQKWRESSGGALSGESSGFSDESWPFQRRPEPSPCFVNPDRDQPPQWFRERGPIDRLLDYFRGPQPTPPQLSEGEDINSATASFSSEKDRTLGVELGNQWSSYLNSLPPDPATALRVDSNGSIPCLDIPCDGKSGEGKLQLAGDVVPFDKYFNPEQAGQNELRRMLQGRELPPQPTEPRIGGRDNILRSPILPEEYQYNRNMGQQVDAWMRELQKRGDITTLEQGTAEVRPLERGNAPPNMSARTSRPSLGGGGFAWFPKLRG